MKFKVGDHVKFYNPGAIANDSRGIIRQIHKTKSLYDVEWLSGSLAKYNFAKRLDSNPKKYLLHDNERLIKEWFGVSEPK